MPVTDVLIIGSGIAGLSLAIRLAGKLPGKRICVVAKEEELQSASRYAQGGISVVCDLLNDSFEQHIEDTLKAGDGLCNRQVVENVIRFAPSGLEGLEAYGVSFDRDASGALLLGREGGHEASRIVHYKDATGLQIVTSLLNKIKTLPGIMLVTHHAAVDLITNRQMSMPSANACYGAFVLDKQSGVIRKYISRFTILATGGIGQVYSITTNPAIATGDGIAMAHHAGAATGNMEFVQFHPTLLYRSEPGATPFLISEALRGYGAFLRNSAGERFMFRYHAQGELACRDVVSRAILNEIKIDGHPCVYLDCTHLDPGRLMIDFPTIFARCLDQGIDITKELIPVVPAAHYLCGGVNTDLAGRTSVNNLYALGECANTGLHGANRLASNSLLEAVVFAEFCANDIYARIDNIAIPAEALNVGVTALYHGSDNGRLTEMRKEVQRLMTNLAGIVRTTNGLQHAFHELETMERDLDALYGDAISPAQLELRNILICAKLIVSQSLQRKENRGVFYNSDLGKSRQ